MTGELTALVTAYEDEGLSPEFIAEDRNLDLAAVKAALMQSSSKYRKDCGAEDENKDELNFSKDEQRRVKDGILDLALGAEDEHLRYKALTYCRDDAKGRRDVVAKMNGNNFNVLLINKLIQNGRSMADKVKQNILNNGHQQKAINV